MANLRCNNHHYYPLPSLDSINDRIHPLGLLLHTNGNIHSNSPMRHGPKQPSGQGEPNYKDYVQVFKAYEREQLRTPLN